MTNLKHVLKKAALYPASYSPFHTIQRNVSVFVVYRTSVFVFYRFIYFYRNKMRMEYKYRSTKNNKYWNVILFPTFYLQFARWFVTVHSCFLVYLQIVCRFCLKCCHGQAAIFLFGDINTRTTPYWSLWYLLLSLSTSQFQMDSTAIPETITNSSFLLMTASDLSDQTKNWERTRGTAVLWSIIL